MAVQKNNYKNIGIGAAVIVAAIAGYLLITGKKLSSLIPVADAAIPPVVTTPGSTTTPVVSNPNCSASQVEFPLPLGAGYTSRPNYLCEQVYITNVQRYLNLWAGSDYFIQNDTDKGYPELTVDGKFGEKLLHAYQIFFGPQYDTITLSSYTNIINDLKNY